MKKLLILPVVLCLLLFTPAIAHAQWCGADPDSGVRTAFGCLPAYAPGTFITMVLRWAVGIMGGIVFLVLVYAGSMYVTSAGDPKRVKAAQELIISAIGGLLLVAFSLVLLNFIGVEILDLGGLGFRP